MGVLLRPKGRPPPRRRQSRSTESICIRGSRYGLERGTNGNACRTASTTIALTRDMPLFLSPGSAPEKSAACSGTPCGARGTKNQSMRELRDWSLARHGTVATSLCRRVQMLLLTRRTNPPCPRPTQSSKGRAKPHIPRSLRPGFPGATERNSLDLFEHW
jgi:hypothetical protein